MVVYMEHDFGGKTGLNGARVRLPWRDWHEGSETDGHR
jgi:hypothetical protein